MKCRNARPGPLRPDTWIMVMFVIVFPECVARFPVSFGGVGVRLCSRKVVSVSATVRNRPRDRRKALHSGECAWSDPESVSS